MIPMFTNYEITKALVEDRQATLRQEARHRRSARRARAGRWSPLPASTQTPAA